MLGVSLSTPFDVMGGLNALNRVTNSPPSLCRYPTDPMVTMDGDHNGNMTVQCCVLYLGASFCIENYVRDEWNSC